MTKNLVRLVTGQIEPVILLSIPLSNPWLFNFLKYLARLPRLFWFARFTDKTETKQKNSGEPRGLSYPLPPAPATVACKGEEMPSFTRCACFVNKATNAYEAF